MKRQPKHNGVVGGLNSNHGLISSLLKGKPSKVTKDLMCLQKINFKMNYKNLKATFCPNSYSQHKSTYFRQLGDKNLNIIDPQSPLFSMDPNTCPSNMPFPIMLNVMVTSVKLHGLSITLEKNSYMGETSQYQGTLCIKIWEREG